MGAVAETGIPRHQIAMPSAIAHLCPKCGFCCNGVIFSDVELNPSERLKFRELGFTAGEARLPPA